MEDVQVYSQSSHVVDLRLVLHLLVSGTLLGEFDTYN